MSGSELMLPAEVAVDHRERLVFVEVAPWRDRERPDPDGGSIPHAWTTNVRLHFAGTPRAGTGHLPLPHDARLRALARELRRDDPERRLVVYTRRSDEFSSATRAWFTLTLAGVDRVRVLDGGLPAWIRAGGPLGSARACPIPEATAIDTDSHPRSEGASALRALRASEVEDVARYGTLLDARSAVAFHGTFGESRTGHIPGAVHAPAAALIGSDGLLLPPTALRRWLLAHRAIGNHQVAAYCGGGVASSSLVFAGALVGQQIGLYVDSWSHWRKSSGRPVEQGEPRARLADNDLDCSTDPAR
ncbi:sulfurtransferase [Protaetiibacter larvae]|uniref:thiosulfate sulfurtransferase n=1 Tax=Protaetiibacter larvae TaxID=2592654 RepID=A0A5C1Y971_9MICO|nr:rhodanese-like domain-containing protein [Protaetiibacter larvae]QEO09447.1 sulfurtransferase [Protaetiibacter larvae]